LQKFGCSNTFPAGYFKKDAAWIWDRQHKQAMSNLKSTISSLLVLRFFDVSQPVVVSVDESPIGIGAVLM
jgi:hypothetical protein